MPLRWQCRFKHCPGAEFAGRCFARAAVFRYPALVDALLVPVFEPTRGELDEMLESRGRGDGGVKLLAELINKGQRRVYRERD